MAIVGCKSHQMMASMPDGGGGKGREEKSPDSPQAECVKAIEKVWRWQFANRRADNNEI